MRIGRTAVQVYRVRTRVLDRYEVCAIVSRAGEILRVELPGQVILVNDRLAATGEGTTRKPATRVQHPISDLSLPQPND